jgi:ribosomal protein S18 acetylase RimI-like enzyme
MLYKRFTLEDADSRMPELVSCYQAVFATSPWNEWRICRLCNQQWGREEQSALAALDFAHCGQPVEDYWPAAQVEADLRRELALPGAACYLAIDDRGSAKDGPIVGFCHGYALDVAGLDQHLGLAGVSQAVWAAFPGIDQVGYQDELGILQEYRGQGIARRLYELRSLSFASASLTTVLVRTMTNPPTVTYQWYTRLGYQVVAEYGDAGGRVILAFSLNG